jgi:hypothetical protein
MIEFWTWSIRLSVLIHMKMVTGYLGVWVVYTN